MSEVSKKLALTGEQFQIMLKIVSKNPVDLLYSESCRKYLALDRWKSNQAMQVHADTHAGVMPGTVEHNRRETEQGLFGSTRRTRRLIFPLSSLEPIYSRPQTLKVLSIGPRTEMEIFNLLAVGFVLPNITALDLISSSPLIDTGDMHRMPYDDRSFDVVISSWVLGYSSEPQLAIDEMVRVCADGGIVAVGLTYESALGTGVVAGESAASAINGSNYKSVAEVTSLIGDRLDKIYFQQEPEPGQKSGPVMIIGRIKHRV